MAKQRYEREIEEILSHLENYSPTKRSQPQHSRGLDQIGQQLARSVGAFFRSFDSGKIMLSGLGLLVLGLFLQTSSPLLARVIVFLGGVFLFWGYLLYFFRHRQARSEKRWRGRVIELPREKSPIELWLTQIWHRFTGRR